MFKIHSKNYNATGCNIYSANILIHNKFYIFNTMIPGPLALFFNKPSNVNHVTNTLYTRVLFCFHYINQMQCSLYQIIHGFLHKYVLHLRGGGVNYAMLERLILPLFYLSIGLKQLKTLSSYMLTHYYFLNEYSLKLTYVFELHKNYYQCI